MKNSKIIALEETKKLQRNIKKSTKSLIKEGSKSEEQKGT